MRLSSVRGSGAWCGDDGSGGRWRGLLPPDADRERPEVSLLPGIGRAYLRPPDTQASANWQHNARIACKTLPIRGGGPECQKAPAR